MLGTGLIQQVFEIKFGKKGNNPYNKIGVRTVYGAVIKNGMINKKHKFKITRDGKLIAKDLDLANLKHFRDEVSSIDEGKECGLTFVQDIELLEGD